MNHKTLIGTAALGLALIGSTAVATSAHAALPNCGGQSAAPQPVPYSCILPPKVIDGTTFAGRVDADGTVVTVTIEIGKVVGGVWVPGLGVRTVPTPAAIIHHQDVSGAGGPSENAQGTIPPGGFRIVLTDSSPCRDGQLDVFVVSTGPNFRLGGPWIQNGVNCVAPTTVASTAPTTTPSGGSTSAPGTTVAFPLVTVVPTSAGVAAVVALPETGSNGADARLLVALGLVLLGAVLIVVTVRKQPLR